MALILPYKEKKPCFGSQVFLAPNATIIGDVEIGDQASIWFGVVVRGDVNYIRIGKRTNIQDLAMIHVTHHTAPTIIGDDVVVGHSVTLHGCVIASFSLIGTGATLLDHARVESWSMVAAGALVAPRTTVKSGYLYAGVPAKPLRRMTEAEKGNIRQSVNNYLAYQVEYARRMPECVVNPATQAKEV